MGRYTIQRWDPRAVLDRYAGMGRTRSTEREKSSFAAGRSPGLNPLDKVGTMSGNVFCRKTYPKLMWPTAVREESLTRGISHAERIATTRRQIPISIVAHFAKMA